ncbi:MAG: hypothetical protein ACFCU6_13945 [Balneolaceae bacterium]
MKKYIILFIAFIILITTLYFAFNRNLTIDIDNNSRIGLSSNPIYDPVDITVYLNEEVIFSDIVRVDILNAKFNRYIIEEKSRFGYNIIEVYSDKAKAYNEYGGYFIFNKNLCISFSTSMRGDYYGFLIYPGQC